MTVLFRKIAIAHRTETEAVRGDTKSLLQHQDTLRDGGYPLQQL